MPRILFPHPIRPNDPDAGLERDDKLIQILFAAVHDDFVYVSNPFEDDAALLERHNGRIFLLAAVIPLRLRWVILQGDDEVVAYGLCLLKYEHVSRVAQIKGASRNPHLLSVPHK